MPLMNSQRKHNEQRNFCNKQTKKHKDKGQQKRILEIDVHWRIIDVH